MKIYWTGIKEDSDDYEADITTCVMSNDSINILFKTKVDQDPVQGRISLKPTNEYQQTTGLWIYTDSKKEMARFSGNANECLETKYEAVVTGQLENFRGKKVVFLGKWDETPFHGSEGGVYELEIDAKIT